MELLYTFEETESVCNNKTVMERVLVDETCQNEALGQVSEEINEKYFAYIKNNL